MIVRLFSYDFPMFPIGFRVNCDGFSIDPVNFFKYSNNFLVICRQPPQEAPKTFPNGSRRPQGIPKTPQKTPKTAQETSQGTQRHPQRGPKDVPNDPRSLPKASQETPKDVPETHLDKGRLYFGGTLESAVLANLNNPREI